MFRTIGHTTGFQKKGREPGAGNARDSFTKGIGWQPSWLDGSGLKGGMGRGQGSHLHLSCRADPARSVARVDFVFEFQEAMMGFRSSLSLVLVLKQSARRQKQSDPGELAQEVLNIHRRCGRDLRTSCQSLIKRSSRSTKPGEGGGRDHKCGASISKRRLLTTYCFRTLTENCFFLFFSLPTSPRSTAVTALAGVGV